VALVGGVHPQPVEDVRRSRQRVARGLTAAARNAALEVHADLAGGPAFGGVHRRGDRIEVLVREEARGPAGVTGHHQSPDAPPPPKEPPPAEKPLSLSPPPPRPPPPMPQIGGTITVGESQPRRPPATYALRRARPPL